MPWIWGGDSRRDLGRRAIYVKQIFNRLEITTNSQLSCPKINFDDFAKPGCRDMPRLQKHLEPTASQVPVKLVEGHLESYSCLKCSSQRK